MYQYAARIERVIDGDTVVAVLDLGFAVSARHTLRLFGINAPEARGRTKPYGKAAKEHLTQLIDALGPVYVETRRDKQGKYGRYLAVLRGAQGQDLNAQMVADGYAVTAEY